MLSRDKRLPFDTWNASGLQNNVFGNHISTFDSSRNHHQGIHSCAPQREPGSVQQAAGTGTFFARDDKQKRETIPMPTFVRRPSTIMVGQQRQQISELQFDKFPTPSTFLCWKKRFKNQVATCSDFPSEAMLWIKEVEMVGSLEGFKSSRSVAGNIFQISRCWTRESLQL